ncbi:MAG: alpha/beta fold hydrolase [Verrucomicrobiaceae bacterium]|nr:alpha/beta fold hydrolase [Verrucomicrobiaceae bacterium]
MKHRAFLLVAILATTGPLLAQKTDTPAKAAPALTLKVSTDRPDAIYKAGEAATFTIEASQPAELTCIFSEDGLHPQPAKKITLHGGKLALTGTRESAGFLQLRVTSGKATALASAAFDPLKIQPSMPVPEDFDAFWKAQKAALAAVPAISVLKSLPSSFKGTELFDVQIDCAGGKPVSGYFAKLPTAAPKSQPAILLVHGAGVRSANQGCASWVLKKADGMLAMDINAHGIPNGKPQAFYDALSAGELRDYRAIGNKDRESCYFKGMFLRLIRAIDFLTARPEWDGRTLIVYGSSQGGFQALAAAGLDERVTFICAGVPAGCDHTGSQARRISGWPKIVPLGPDGKPDAAALQTSRYFDCVNFATQAKCQGAALTVGYIDTTCPPTSVYAAYNALRVPKNIHADVLAGHSNTAEAIEFMQDAALRHLRRPAP